MFLNIRLYFFSHLLSISTLLLDLSLKKFSEFFITLYFSFLLFPGLSSKFISCLYIPSFVNWLSKIFWTVMVPVYRSCLLLLFEVNKQVSRPHRKLFMLYNPWSRDDSWEDLSSPHRHLYLYFILRRKVLEW